MPDFLPVPPPRLQVKARVQPIFFQTDSLFLAKFTTVVKVFDMPHDFSAIQSTSRMIAVPPGETKKQTTLASLQAQYGPGGSVELCTVLPGPELAWTSETANSQRLKRNNIGLFALAGTLAVLSLAVLGFIIASVPHAVSAGKSAATLNGDRMVGASVHFKNSTMPTWMARPTGHSSYQCCKTVPVWWI